MFRIIILGNEPELIRLARAINRLLCNSSAEILMFNDPKIAEFEKTISDYLFLIGHANAQGIGDYDYKGLVKEFGAHLKGAAKAVYLAGCSTQAEAAQILKDGFVPATLASSVKNYTGRAVYGAPGVLVRTGNAKDGSDDKLHVEVSVGTGFKPSDIFVPAK